MSQGGPGETAAQVGSVAPRSSGVREAVERLSSVVRRASDWIGRMILVGPDPLAADESEPPGVLQRLLPWSLRLLLVLGTWVVAFIWHRTGPAQQISWGLSYAGAIAVSLAVSFALPILVANLVLALLWLLTVRRTPLKAVEPARYRAHLVLTFLNRQVGHLEALWIWTALALSWQPKINYQLPLLAAVFLLGVPVINGLAQWRRYRRLQRRPPGQQPAPDEEYPARRSSGELNRERRPLIYLATALGLLLLALGTLDSQALNILPLAMAFGVGDLVRAIRHRQRNRNLQTMDRAAREAAQSMHRQDRLVSRRADAGIAVPVIISGLLATVVGSFYAKGRLESQAHAALNGALPSTDSCLPEQGGPQNAQLSLFLLSDTQLHELGGKRFPGQMELADTIVPVALRPVELDMLSSFAVARFARMYEARAKETANLNWAHLGDLADLGCRGELVRATDLLSLFPARALAGVAPGNHDMSFTGNFFWSPFWTEACPSGRLDKWGSTELLATFARTAAEQRPGAAVHEDAGVLPRLLGGRGGSLSSVSPLGVVRHQDRDRGLIGVFLDTSDGRAFDWGIAGSFGAFSQWQADAVKKMIADIRGGAGRRDGLPAAYGNPVFLVFAHHPLAGLQGNSASRMRALLGELDGSERDPHYPRLLAVISAHTHRAESHRHCLGRRVLREIVVGSTTDPPQQAAWVEVGPNGRDRLALRLRTLPAVARSGYTCDISGPRFGGVPQTPPPTLSAGECRGHVARLRTESACEGLFDTGAGPARDCAELEERKSLPARLQRLKVAPPPFEPDEILGEQRARAASLLRCACRPLRPDDKGPGPCGAWSEDEPFANEAYVGLLGRLQDHPERSAELSCLAWAAAAVQQHKDAGMTLAEALRCAYDDPSLPAAQETVALLEARACR